MQPDAFHLGSLADPAQCHGPIDLAGTPPAQLRAWLRKLVEIRCAEEKIGDEFGKAVIKCPCHLVIGQEAPAVGVAAHIRPGDRVFGAHRSHAHFLSLGGTLHHLLAEVRLCPAAEPRLVSVKLDHYCVEAVRRVCLCSALGQGSVLLAPRLRFSFRPQVVQVPPGDEVAVAAAH